MRLNEYQFNEAVQYLEESIFQKNKNAKFFRAFNKEKEKCIQIYPLGNNLTDLKLGGVSFSSRRYFTPDGYLKIGLYTGETIDKVKERECINTLENTDPSKILLTSDWHFFKSETDKFIKQLSAVSDKDTILLILGDVVYGDDALKKEGYKKIYKKSISERKTCWIDCKKILNSVPHKKAYLVLGNHDEKYINDLYKDGFDFVSNIIETEKYVFTHIPTKTNKINIHGHNHGNGRTVNFNAKKHFDVGYVPLNRDPELLNNRGFFFLNKIVPSNNYMNTSGELKYSVVALSNSKYQELLPLVLNKDIKDNKKISILPIEDNELSKEIFKAGKYNENEIIKMAIEYFNKKK